MKDNTIVTELTESEAAIARKVLPVVEEFVGAMTKDLIAMSLNFLASLRDIIDRYEETRIPPTRDEISSVTEAMEPFFRNFDKAKFMAPELIMKLIGINLEDFK